MSQKPMLVRSQSRMAGAFFTQALGFWRGPTTGTAWGLSLGVLMLVIANLGVQIGINRWNGFFFDALQQKNGGAVATGVGLILGLALAAALVAVVLVHVRMRLQVRWRQWLTGHLVARWMGGRRFYQLNITETEGSNPEYRIADDTRMATEPLVDFVIGLTNAAMMAVAFIGVLWVVGGNIRLDALGHAFDVPGYMVWMAIVYSALASTAMLLVGRPLITRVERKNAAEARLRYELTRIRESAETIALIGGDDDERGRIDETVADVVARWIGVIVMQARLTWVINGNAVLAPVIPLLLGAPKYLSGDLTLGALMQVATAFVQVQVALNWLVENSIRLAEWFASAQRVVELTDSLEALDATLGPAGDHTIVLGPSPDDAIHLRNLSLRQQSGVLMLQGAEVAIRRGEKVLVKGQSGSGKSTLIRAMAGLWPWGSGEILRPTDASTAFMPQRPYIPIGTLRHALLYPEHEGPPVADAALTDALKRCGLTQLIPRLDEEDHWDRILSGGEQQRLAFARLIVKPPRIVIMDEATSALDEISQTQMMTLLRTDLRASTVVSVGHRPGLEAFHDREIYLARAEGDQYVTARQRHYRRFRLRDWFGFRNRP